jgi:hypothetical protein
VSTLPGELLAHLGLANGPGRSIGLELRLTRRDALVRSLKLSSARLSSELSRYRTIAWVLDRTKDDNPYQAGDRRSKFFQILKITDRDLSARQVRRILRAGHQTGF